MARPGQSSSIYVCRPDGTILWAAQRYPGDYLSFRIDDVGPWVIAVIIDEWTRIVATGQDSFVAQVDMSTGAHRITQLDRRGGYQSLIF
jgi:hypothetical protein